MEISLANFFSWRSMFKLYFSEKNLKKIHWQQDTQEEFCSILRKNNVFSFFSSDDLKVEVPRNLKLKPPVSELGFGKHFTDHMLRISWNENKGWDKPIICQLQDFKMHPASKVRQKFWVHNLTTFKHLC